MSTDNTPAPAINPTEEDFDDLALFSGITDEANEIRDEAAEMANRAPVSYVDEGNYWLRFYPEIQEVDGVKKLHLMRRFWSYTGILKGLRRLPAPNDENCPVRLAVRKLKDAKLEDAWKYQAKQEALIKVRIFKSSLPKDHKYIKLDTPMFLVLRRKQISALADFMADLSAEDLRRILNPNRIAPMIKMSYTKGAGGSSSFGFDLKEEALPELPENFPSIFTALLDESKVATPEEVEKVRKAVNMILATGQNIINPQGSDDPNLKPLSPVSSDAERTAAQSETAQLLAEARASAALKAETDKATDPKVTPIIPVDAAGGKECPSGRQYGKMHDATNVDCVICPLEAPCSEAQAAEANKDVPT